MFYERYLSLCREKGISPSTAATKAGFNKGTVSVWKRKYEGGIDVVPDQDVVNKICRFFGCSESWLRGIQESRTEKASATDGERRVSDDDIKFALFGGDSEITDAMYDEVKRFAQMVKLREETEKKKE